MLLSESISLNAYAIAQCSMFIAKEGISFALQPDLKIIRQSEDTQVEKIDSITFK